MPVHVTGIGTRVPQYCVVVNTTSRSNDFGHELSPFFLGPVRLYREHIAANVENAWQFSKVYPDHVDEENNPTQKYFDWATKGWDDSWAHRYPKGKGAKPLYSYWDGEKLSYVEARKRIYAPIYAEAVEKTDAYKKLQLMYDEGRDLYLRDFDGYDHEKLGMTLEDVMNNSSRSMGHAFVIAMLLQGKRCWDARSNQD